MSEVTDLIDRYKSGEITLEDLAQIFRARHWPTTRVPRRPSTYLEMAALAQEDPGSLVPNSFDDVEVAFIRHDLSVDEYKVLKAAMVEALQKET